MSEDGNAAIPDVLKVTTRDGDNLYIVRGHIAAFRRGEGHWVVRVGNENAIYVRKPTWEEFLKWWSGNG